MIRSDVSTPYQPGQEASSSLLGLARSEGFRVESPDGYVGVVEALRFAPSSASDHPSELAVHAGRSSETLLIIPRAEVDSVDVLEQRVVLRPSPRIAATERMTPPGKPDVRREH